MDKWNAIIYAKSPIIYATLKCYHLLRGLKMFYVIRTIAPLVSPRTDSKYLKLSTEPTTREALCTLSFLSNESKGIRGTQR